MTRILVFEDETPIRENIHELLEFEGFEVQSVSDGRAGLQQTRQWLPDLIICDIMMPELDGLAVLQELQRDSLTATIPFIFLTARATRDDMRAGMNLGADDYLTKPFTKDELLQTVKARLARHAAIETQRLQRLSHRLLMMHESERLQVVRDLHSEAEQILAGLKMVLETSNRLPQDANRAKMNAALDLVTRLATVIRDLSFDLRPLVLDDLGLLPALTQHFDHYTARTEIRVQFRHAGLQQRLRPDVEIAAFRIIQEALNNVAQHTSVCDVQVQVWVENGKLRLRIEDRGQGFELESTLTRGDNVGLTNMHGRASLVGGQLSVESVPGLGTIVRAALPVADHHEEAAPAELAIPVTLALSAPQHDITETISIVLADNHDLARQGMRSLLETEPAFAIVGEATQGRAALELVAQFQPAVLIVDFDLAGLKGTDITRYVANHVPQTHVLMLSLHESEAYVLEALKSGSTGYALKQSAADELVQAVREVAAGRQYLSPTISEHALEAYINRQHHQTTASDIYSVLTAREREVLQWVVDGLTSAEIGSRLGISQRTVEKHRENIMRKLGTRNQADLVRYVLEHGFTTSK